MGILTLTYIFHYLLTRHDSQHNSLLYLSCFTVYLRLTTNWKCMCNINFCFVYFACILYSGFYYRLDDNKRTHLNMGDVSTKFLSILHYRDDCNWRKVKCVSDDVLGTQTHFEHAYKNGTITK